MDFSILDAENWKSEDGLFFLNSKKKLESIGNNPLICVANYLFDSLKHDAFSVSNENNPGDLGEWRIKISSSFNPKEPQFLPSIIGTSDIKWKIHHVQEKDQNRKQISGPYLNPLLNKILNWYQFILSDKNNFPNGASFVLPLGSIRLLEELIKFSNSNLFLITGDKADCYENEFDDYKTFPDITSHDGCFSFTTNFDAFSKLFALKNGFFKHLTKDSEFCVSVFSINEKGDNNDELLCSNENFKAILKNSKEKEKNFLSLQAIGISIGNFGPENYFNSYKNINIYGQHYKSFKKLKKGNKTLQLRYELAIEDYFNSLLSQIKFSNYDVDFFYKIHEGLIKCLKVLHDIKSNVLKKILYKIYKNDYFLPSMSLDIPFIIAQTFQLLNDYERAFKFFLISLNRFPNEFECLFNLGICSYNLKQYEKSQKYFLKCKKLEPDDEDVQNWLLKISKKCSTEVFVTEKKEKLETKEIYNSGNCMDYRNKRNKYE